MTFARNANAEALPRSSALSEIIMDTVEAMTASADIAAASKYLKSTL
jgi:hypothetical protein